MKIGCSIPSLLPWRIKIQRKVRRSARTIFEHIHLHYLGLIAKQYLTEFINTSTQTATVPKVWKV